MKIRVASDFHLEFLQFKEKIVPLSRDINDRVCLTRQKDEKEQTLLLAGDTVTAARCEDMTPFFNNLSERFKDVYFIAGNHEHYHYNYNRTHDRLRQFVDHLDNVHFLERDTVQLADDVMLYAATMWTNCHNENPMSMFYVGSGMQDFHIIGYGAKDQNNVDAIPAFTVQHSIDIFNETINDISIFDAAHKDMKTIVMTHHAPSFRSTSPKFKQSRINGGFGSNLDAFIEKRDINLWVHGHMHNCSKYKINNTIIRANPRGYGQENFTYYNPNLVLDTDDLV